MLSISKMTKQISIFLPCYEVCIALFSRSFHEMTDIVLDHFAVLISAISVLHVLFSASFYWLHLSLPLLITN